MQGAVLMARIGEMSSREVGISSDREEVAGEGVVAPTGPADILPLAEYEKRYFRRVLDHTGGVIHGDRGAAKLLGMKPTTLRSRLEKLGIIVRKHRHSV